MFMKSHESNVYRLVLTRLLKLARTSNRRQFDHSLVTAVPGMPYHSENCPTQLDLVSFTLFLVYHLIAGDVTKN